MNTHLSWTRTVELRREEMKYMVKHLYKLKGDIVEEMFQTDDPNKKQDLNEQQKMLINIIKELERALK